MKLIRKWMTKTQDKHCMFLFIFASQFLIDILNIQSFDVLYMYTCIYIGGNSVQDMELEMEKVLWRKGQ